MTRKNIFLLFFAVVLLVVYAVYFTDWFAPKTFQVFHTTREIRSRLRRDGAMPPLNFGMNRQLRLTEIKVVSLAEWTTNHHALPLWHLVTNSNSVPIKNFAYGQYIPGLHPAVRGTHPTIPETNVMYRLFLTAGKFKAEHDFELK